MRVAAHRAIATVCPPPRSICAHVESTNCESGPTAGATGLGQTHTALVPPEQQDSGLSEARGQAQGLCVHLWDGRECFCREVVTAGVLGLPGRPLSKKRAEICCEGPVLSGTSKQLHPTLLTHQLLTAAFGKLGARGRARPAGSVETPALANFRHTRHLAQVTLIYNPESSRTTTPKQVHWTPSKQKAHASKDPTYGMSVLCAKCIKNSYNYSRKDNPLKMADLKRHFCKEETPTANKDVQTYWTPLVIRTTWVKTTRRHHFTPAGGPDR